MVVEFTITRTIGAYHH